MKLTYSKSDPYKSGWKGWADWVDVFLDGRHIGMLFAEGEDHRRYMAYTFTNRLSNRDNAKESEFTNVNVNVIGLRAAKAKLAARLAEILAIGGDR